MTAKKSKPKKAAKKAAAPKGPITQEELTEMFKGSIPPEAAMLLLNPHNHTLPHLRAELRKMADTPRTVTVAQVLDAIWAQTAGGNPSKQQQMAMLSAYNFGRQQAALDPTGAVKP